MNESRIAAVVVTYNRLPLLKECVDCLRKQTRNLDEIIVVNNSSSDGTLEWLKKQKDLTVITQENMGSAGGQYTGIKTAFDKGHDRIWCMDDDCLAERDALKELVEFNGSEVVDKIGFLASKVLWLDKTPHLMNLPGYFFRGNRWTFIGVDNFATGVHKIDACSFVSCLFSREAIKKVGYPNPDFFIWFDDVDYTVRFRDFDNYYVAKSVVIHKTNTNTPPRLGSFDPDFDLKKYYGLRNFYFFYKKWNKWLLVRFSCSFLFQILMSAFRGTFTTKSLILSLTAVNNGLRGNFRSFQVSR